MKPGPRWSRTKFCSRSIRPDVSSPSRPTRITGERSPTSASSSNASQPPRTHSGPSAVTTSSTSDSLASKFQSESKRSEPNLPVFQTTVNLDEVINYVSPWCLGMRRCTGWKNKTTKFLITILIPFWVCLWRGEGGDFLQQIEGSPHNHVTVANVITGYL